MEAHYFTPNVRKRADGLARFAYVMLLLLYCNDF